MLAQLVFALMMTAGVSASAEDWKPFHPFVGTWTGTRATSTGKVSVTRYYESVGGNQHLLVSDRMASDPSPWGLVSIDPVRGGFVLRRFGADGSMVELVLSDVSNDGATLVFDTAPDDGGSSVERITLERHGRSEFVERVELRANGAPFALISETQFRRKH